ncbi:hypothetical protein [Chryseobacterium sp.]|uniref:hypothetical protein n=1 Tax=Chryseobacterium sp. TaxID=1871047 RepID=UPI00321A28C0
MNTALKNKVEALLIRRGNNVNDVKEMVELHFELGSKFYTSVKTIADYIRTVY